ncbi:MAG: choice-of-anchor B family protein [Fidelibacterota bacterium]
MKTKKYIFVLLLFVMNWSYGQVSDNVTFISTTNPGGYASDIWGYTSPTGEEYALVGSWASTFVINTSSDPENPYVTGEFDGPPSSWRDLKTYGHYAYVGTEGGGGVQIIDLADPENPQFVGNYATGFSSSHNIHIADGYLYVVGAAGYNIHIISLSDPENPETVGGWNGEYIHDLYVKNDTAWGCAIYSSTIYVIDVSDKTNPQTITSWQYYGAAHACWLSEDSKYLITSDETYGGNIKIWDVQDLNNVNMLDSYTVSANHSVHNVFVVDNLIYASYYADGLRIIDFSDPTNLVEVGYYDSTEEEGLFVGAWGTFPYTNNCTAYISDMSNGLLVVSYDDCQLADDLDPNPVEHLTAYSDYSTPTSIALTWEDPTLLAGGGDIPPFTVVIERDSVVVAEVSAGTESYVDGGLVDGEYYFYTLFVRLTESDSTSIISAADAICGGSPVPSFPENFSGSEEGGIITLSWTNPTTQIDGTPLDDLAGIYIYRNGNFFANVITSEAGAIVSWQDEPEYGFSYDYQILAVDNESEQNTSSITDLYRFWMGDVPDFLIWNPDNISPTSATGLSRSFYELGRSAAEVQNLTEFGGNLFTTGYKAVFVLCGFAPETYEIWDGQWGTQGDLFKLRYYLNDGGSMYMEAGDEFSNLNAATVTELFSVDVALQGGYDLEGIVGEDGTFAAGMTFDYAGDASEIDQLVPLVEAFPIFSNSGTPFFTGVANDGGTYRTIAATFEFGGLVDGATTKTVLLDSMLHFLVDAEDLSMDDPAVPSVFALYQNFPNPFNSSTTIRLSVPDEGDVQLTIYDVLGREVSTLISGELVRGSHELIWDASSVSSGIYIYRLTRSGETLSKRMILLK